MLRVLSLVLLTFGLGAKGSVIDEGLFQVGAKWTWSYSDQGEEGWNQPYVYETYRVDERMGSLVKITMSSSSTLGEKTKPHHYFIIDLSDCLEVGKSIAKLKRLKIDFYTNSDSEGWRRVSKKHKGLAFTEKFNCLQDWRQVKTSVEPTIFGQRTPLVQLVGTGIRSWYLIDREQAGAAVLRFTKNYKMELVEAK